MAKHRVSLVRPGSSPGTYKPLLGAGLFSVSNLNKDWKGRKKPALDSGSRSE